MGRDFQRQRVYNACAAIRAGKRLETVAEMQAYVDHLLDSAWARRRWGAQRITVKDGRGHRRATGGGGIVQMPTWAREERTLLHEIAHNLASPYDSHGPAFVRVMLELVSHVYNAEQAKAFRDACRKYRVEIGPPLKLRSTLPPAPTRRVERPFRVEIKRRGQPVRLLTVTETTIRRAVAETLDMIGTGDSVQSLRVWLGRDVKRAASRKGAR